MVFGEPTNNEILSGSKGILEYELEFLGIKAHSSNPEKGKSANLNAIKFLMELNEFYEKNIKIFENKSFEIPYTTMNIGVIKGGSEKNSVSAKCVATLDFRPVKKEHINDLKEKIEQLSQKYNCKYSIIECLEPYINKTNFSINVKTANFITEASLVKTKTRIILGAGPVTAHEVNEYISEESYLKLVKQYKEIIEKLT